MALVQVIKYINLDDMNLPEIYITDLWDYIVNDWSYTTCSPYDEFGLFYLDEEFLIHKDLPQDLRKVVYDIWAKYKRLFPDRESIPIHLGD